MSAAPWKCVDNCTCGAAEAASCTPLRLKCTCLECDECGEEKPLVLDTRDGDYDDERGFFSTGGRYCAECAKEVAA